MIFSQRVVAADLGPVLNPSTFVSALDGTGQDITIQHKTEQDRTAGQEKTAEVRKYICM